MKNNQVIRHKATATVQEASMESTTMGRVADPSASGEVAMVMAHVVEEDETDFGFAGTKPTSS
eukprot:scaffold3023_cov175-Amphora_coffeaeformis.AAC.10